MFNQPFYDSNRHDKVVANSALQVLATSHLPLDDIAPFDMKPAPKAGKMIISAPHGGACYPQELVAQTSSHLRRFRTLEDIGTAQLAHRLHHQGRPVISARLSRAILDLNRPADALDPLLYDTPVPPLETTHPFAPYVAAGYGVMPRLSGQREALYQDKLPFDLAKRLIDAFHQPYHDALGAMIAALPQGGLLVDIHSMPSHSAGKPLPDIVFGDNFGRSLPPDYRQVIDQFMKSVDLSHGWNHPYAGGYITCQYGTTGGPHHSLQIEINRAIYLKRENGLLLPKLTMLSHVLTALFSTLEAHI